MKSTTTRLFATALAIFLGIGTTSHVFAQQNTLKSYDWVSGLAASYNEDDQYRVVLIGTGAGDIHEIFYKGTLAFPTNLGDSLIGHVDGLVGLTGFYNADDQYRVALAASADGTVTEIYYHPQKGSGKSVLGRFEGVVGIAGFFARDDRYRIALVATKDGDVHELYYHPAKGRGESVVAHYDGLVGLAAAFGSHLSWNDRNLVTVTSDGTVRQLLYNPNRPRMERVIDANNGVISVAMDQNHFFTASSDGRLRDILFANGQVKELGVIPGIDRVAADGFDWSNLVYSLKVGSVHKYLWQLAPLPPSPAMPPVPQWPQWPR